MIMTRETFPFEPELYFETRDAQQRLVADAAASGDTAWLTHAIGIVARARGMAEVAKETGLSRQALYAAFGPKGNPTISTVMKVLACLGLTLEVKQAA
jgi:probable addiction module antidote protein